MSMADGLLHERQEEDDITRQRVLAVAVKIRRNRPSPRDIDKAVEYLEQYARGRQLL